MQRNHELEEFFQSLTDRQRRVHTIAVSKLGTSYDPARTNAFKEWLSSKQKKMAK